MAAGQHPGLPGDGRGAPGALPFWRHVTLDRPIDDGIDVVRLLHSARDVDAACGHERQRARSRTSGVDPAP